MEATVLFLLFSKIQDGGMTVHADDPVLCDKMASAAKKLNIKGHWVGMHQEKKYIYGPTDLEGHQGKDNRYYLLDFSRVFPPEYPQPELPKRSVLYNLLRPEFVASYPKPLSSDALSGFGKHDSESHNSEIQEATQFLIEKIIPAFANSLSSLSAKQSNIVELFHREGINIRHMGLVRHHCASAEWKKCLLIEMVARVIKDDVKETLRATVSKLKVPSEKPCKEAISVYVNFLLGKRQESLSFWKGEIKTKITNKFRLDALSDDEKRNDYLLNFGIDISALFTR
jgi:hypothetical protein